MGEPAAAASGHGASSGTEGAEEPQPYEEQRARNIAENNAVLRQSGLLGNSPAKASAAEPLPAAAQAGHLLRSPTRSPVAAAEVTTPRRSTRPIPPEAKKLGVNDGFGFGSDRAYNAKSGTPVKVASKKQKTSRRLAASAAERPIAPSKPPPRLPLFMVAVKHTQGTEHLMTEGAWAGEELLAPTNPILHWHRR